MNFKTIEELKEYFNNLEVQNTYQVGPRCSNHQRAVYQIGTAQILQDIVLPYNWFKPSQEWFWTGDGFPSNIADNYAKKYNARVEEAYYCDEDNPEYMLFFDTLDDVLQWLFDNQLNQLNS